MPDIIVPFEGEIALLDTLLRATDFSSREWFLHLYQNDFGPVRNTVVADFVESTFPGYAPLELVDSTWLDPIIIGTVASTTYGAGPVTFTPEYDTGEPVFGYYVTTASGALCLWCQRFDFSTIPTTLAPVIFRPVLTLKSLFQPG